jgi:uroporphyrinogen-III synthase
MTTAAVLITRPEPGASETAHRIAALGLTPIVAPVLEIRATAGHLPPTNQIAAILLTSGNAVGALPQGYRHIPTLTVGAATEQMATPWASPKWSGSGLTLAMAPFCSPPDGVKVWPSPLNCARRGIASRGGSCTPRFPSRICRRRRKWL